MLDKSSNPAFSKASFASAGAGLGVMTLKGTLNKSVMLLLLIIVSASVTWNMVLEGNTSASGLMITGAVGGLILAIITIFKKEWSGITAPLYAFAEGLFLGGISAVVEQSAMISGEEGYGSGIVFNAVALTFGIFLIMFLLYRNEIIKPTKKFQAVILGGISAVFLVYMTNWILSMFGVQIPFLHSNGVIGIGFSVAVIALAGLSLILDFKQIEDGVKQGAPKYMEWYSAFGLMVTLVWLYIEILRLLAILSGRD